MCVCVRACARVRACVRACLCVCVFCMCVRARVCMNAGVDVCYVYVLGVRACVKVGGVVNLIEYISKFK